MTPYQYQQELDLYNRAIEAAKAATVEYLLNNPGRWYPCGFAWVRIKPARGRFVAMCREHLYGDVSMEGGYIIYNPSQSHTQSMDAKEVGAQAFAKVLREAGLTANVECAID